MSYTLDKDTVIAADLDGTLAPSKEIIDPEMASLISKWLEHRRFAVISGGEYSRFQKQIISHLPSDAKFENLHLFPTNGAAYYQFKDGAWKEIYQELLSNEEKDKIIGSFKEAFSKSGIAVEKTYGEQIEFRGGQVTFSALGQEAPLEEKAPWDPDQAKRKLIVSCLAPLLPEFAVSIAGATSIDVTRNGVDKAYAIKKMEEYLNIDSSHIIFIGDALFPGGNDWSAKKADVHCIRVKDPEETKKIIASLL